VHSIVSIRFNMNTEGIHRKLIVSILKRASAWLTLHLHYFHPQTALRMRLDPPHKPFVELVFLCIEWERLLTERKNRDRGLHSPLEKIIAFTNNLIKTYDVPGIFWHDPEALPAFMLLPRFASLVGLSPNKFSTELNSLITEGYGLIMERLPFRCLDLRYNADHAMNNIGDIPSLVQLYPYTVVAQRPPISYLYWNDLYAITHTIFYVTDMGHCPIEQTIASFDAEYLRWLVQTVMGMMLWKGDLDIVAECLMCARFLNCTWNYIIESAWESIAKRQRGSGVIPGPTFNEKDANSLDGKELSEYEFVHGYHTTLVTILAALPWLQEKVELQGRRGVGNADG